MNAEQQADVRINVDGRSTPVLASWTVAPCSALVVGLHGLPSLAGDLNFSTTIRWPRSGSATLIMRSTLPDAFWLPSMTLVPPIDRVR